MPGFELFGDKERREVQQVLDTGVLMRYGFDGMREGRWKAAELEKNWPGGCRFPMPSWLAAVRPP